MGRDRLGHHGFIMLILAIDTSTSAITTAVHDGSRVVAEVAVLDPRRHTEQLGPLVEAVLAQAGTTPSGITDVVVGTGPGPYTGLRVGLVFAKVFGLAAGLPVHGVGSLDVLAHQARGSVDGPLLVATDARRKEVYWATYAVVDGAVERLSGPAVDRPAELAEAVRELPTVGRGPVLYPELLPHGIPVLDVSAGALADVAVGRITRGEPMPVDALYLRRPDATPSAGKPKTTLAQGHRR